MLRDSYRSDDSDIAAEFIVPCLTSASTYDRATGYFTSGILPHLLTGLQPFVRNGGRIRLVASPHFTSDDIDQINRGYAERSLVVSERTLEELARLSAANPNVFAQLSWLVANRVLDIRLALLRGDAMQGIYHEKFGIFSDDVDRIAFIGSLNETLAALLGNFEYIDVFTSWDDPSRVEEKRDYFERLWSGETPRLDIVNFPDAARECLLRAAPPDYPPDLSLAPSRNDSDQRELRPHQIEALDAWRENGRRGLLEMATGTGKTFTALSEIGAMLRAGEIQTAVILAPYIAIADQWREECEMLLRVDPIVCHSQSGDWKARLRTHLALSRFEKRQLVVIALYDTASGDEFRSHAARFDGPIVVVADEVHNITIDDADAVLLERYDYRLGLSATPDRYLDDIGTERVRRYFEGTVFRYSLAMAIAAGILTPYDYHPFVCGPQDEHGFSTLAGVNAAKLNKFVATFESTPAHTDGYALVYCNPAQLEDTKAWLGVTLRKHIHTFTAQEDLVQRRAILKDFGSGFYQVLVAMRCLDEGVDVPPTRSAFLLGSSENPKQFVQRRGRVLRRYPGKLVASIYDFVYLPTPQTKAHEDELRKELTRFAEFALSARNAGRAFEIIVQAAESRGIPLREYITQGV
jgi:superfamily II DNA or RNA helicase